MKSAGWTDERYGRSIRLVFKVTSEFSVMVWNHDSEGWRVGSHGRKLHQSLDNAKAEAIREGIRRAQRNARHMTQIANALKNIVGRK